MSALVLLGQACSSDEAEDSAPASGSSQGGTVGAGVADEGTAGAGTTLGAGGAGESSTGGVARQGGAAGVAGEPWEVAGGASAMPSAGAGAGGGASEVPLTPVDGWVDGASNVLGVQGAIFAHADETSATGLMADFTGSNACMAGSAARVDLQCTPVPPATDCFGTFWGAAISLNLNQSLVSGSGGPAMAFDASSLSGFAFALSGPTIPTQLRFRVDTADGQFCVPPSRPLAPGENVYLFSELLAQCWKPGGASAVGVRDRIVRLTWQVVTRTSSGVPFDFCIENLRALK